MRFGKLKELDECRMARSRSESTFSREERSSAFVGKHHVGSIVGGEMVTELPDSRQEHRVRRRSSRPRTASLCPTFSAFIQS